MFVGDLDVGTLVDQKFDNFEMIIIDRRPQRCRVRLRGAIHIRASLQQEFHNPHPIGGGRNPERSHLLDGFAIELDSPDLCTRLLITNLAFLKIYQ